MRSSLITSPHGCATKCSLTHTHTNTHTYAHLASLNSPHPPPQHSQSFMFRIHRHKEALKYPVEKTRIQRFHIHRCFWFCFLSEIEARLVPFHETLVAKMCGKSEKIHSALSCFKNREPQISDDTNSIPRTAVEILRLVVSLDFGMRSNTASCWHRTQTPVADGSARWHRGLSSSALQE